jgi:short-subunit dehydrogenase
LEALPGSLRREVTPLGIDVMIVEPGGFRTDFSGRSLAQSSSAIADYADTAGKRRKENDTTHGTQPGDPVKAAQAMITAIESPDVPAFLLLGQDAVSTYQAALEDRAAEVRAWEKLSTGTDFGD